jgi:hypothetical protein
MQATGPILDLWTLVRGAPSIDPDDLLHAIELEAARPHPDFRTRLLIRDGVAALSGKWGQERTMARLSPATATAVAGILAEHLGECGFPTLESRIMQHTDTQTLLQFLRELGSRVDHETRLDIGGSGALILAGLLRRHTDDLDAVDEVPISIRTQHDLLDSLASRYGLRLTHFQSHFLPVDWAKRVISLGKFGKLDVYLVDPGDIFLSKLFSAREKDLDDLRVLSPALDRAVIALRLGGNCRTLLGEPLLRANADRNWYIVFGDHLPG